MIEAMVKPYRSGVARRRSILDALRLRLDAGEQVSVDALAEATKIPRGTVARHLSIMRKAGLIETRYGHGGGIWLTDAGRIATD